MRPHPEEDEEEEQQQQRNKPSPLKIQQYNIISWKMLNDFNKIVKLKIKRVLPQSKFPENIFKNILLIEIKRF